MICFPESFSFIGAKDGDSIKIAQPLDGPILQQYCSLARYISNFVKKKETLYQNLILWVIEVTHLRINCRESGIWLSLGGFQEKGSDDEHLFNTHVVVDDAGNIRSTYSKIYLYVTLLLSSLLCNIWLLNFL